MEQKLERGRLRCVEAGVGGPLQLVNQWHMAGGAMPGMLPVRPVAGPPMPAPDPAPPEPHAVRVLPAEPPLAIRTRGLARRFPGGFGVAGLDLNVPTGAIYGFLGPNGAGKTTTIRLLLSLLRPDAGEIALFGTPLAGGRREALRQVGALVESPSLYGHLSGRDNLEVTRRLLGAPQARVDAALRRVDLLDAAHRRVRDYSLGMRQRLAIALALLGEPRLLVLDEPSNGLDPAGIVDLRALLRGLADEGITVFVSSHLLSEVEQIATHVGVLHEGRLRFEGRLEELRGRVRPRLRLRCEPVLRASDLLARAGESVSAPDADGSLCIELGERDAAGINRLLVEHGIAVSELSREQRSLESLFFDLTVDASLEDAA
jgi:ABC-type multidrug transport system ATPase subunit